MAQTIKLKRSATASQIPTTAQLELGELAINTNDGKVFLKKDNGTASIVEVGASPTNISTGNLSSSGNTTLGDAAADALTVNATAAFNAPADFNSSLNVDGAFATTANSTLGNAAADVLTVNATAAFNAPADFNSSLNVDGAFSTTANSTLGNAAADTLTVNATSTFNAPADFNSSLNVDGATTLNGNVTLGDSATDIITINGSMSFTGGVSLPASTAATTEVLFMNGTSIDGDAGMTYNLTTDTLTLAGDIAVNGGDLTTTATTFNMANTTATTVNIGGAATTVEIGATTGTTSVNNNLTVDGNTTLGNATTDTVTYTARAASDLLPSANLTYDLGSTALRWTEVNAQKMNIGSASAPASPVDGTVYYDTALDSLMVYDGAAWVAAGGGSTGPSSTVAATAPASPATGDFWYDTANSALKTWDGSAWQTAGGAAGAPADAGSSGTIAVGGVALVMTTGSYTGSAISALGTVAGSLHYKIYEMTMSCFQWTRGTAGHFINYGTWRLLGGTNPSTALFQRIA